MNSTNYSYDKLGVVSADLETVQKLKHGVTRKSIYKANPICIYHLKIFDVLFLYPISISFSRMFFTLWADTQIFQFEVHCKTIANASKLRNNTLIRSSS